MLVDPSNVSGRTGPRELLDPDVSGFPACDIERQLCTSGSAPGRRPGLRVSSSGGFKRCTDPSLPTHTASTRTGRRPRPSRSQGASAETRGQPSELLVRSLRESARAARPAPIVCYRTPRPSGCHQRGPSGGTQAPGNGRGDPCQAGVAAVWRSIATRSKSSGFILRRSGAAAPCRRQ